MPTAPVSDGEAGQAGGGNPARRRRRRLVELVERQGYCAIMELSRELRVSDMTVRRDVQRLVRDGVLRSVHGGVTTLPGAVLHGTDIGVRGLRMGAAKRAIARGAARLAPLAGAIAIDAGTTTLELARALPVDAGLSVVTHSLSVVNALLPHGGITVICPGGNLYRGSESFGGSSTVAAIEGLRVRTFFLAASGLRADGVYTGSDIDVMTKRALVAAADEVVLVADSSKFAISAMVRACSLAEVDRAVVDDGVSGSQLALFADHGVDVVVVPVAEEGEDGGGGEGGSGGGPEGEGGHREVESATSTPMLEHEQGC